MLPFDLQMDIQRQWISMMTIAKSPLEAENHKTKARRFDLIFPFEGIPEYIIASCFPITQS